MRRQRKPGHAQGVRRQRRPGQLALVTENTLVPGWPLRVDDGPVVSALRHSQPLVLVEASCVVCLGQGYCEFCPRV